MIYPPFSEGGRSPAKYRFPPCAQPAVPRDRPPLQLTLQPARRERPPKQLGRFSMHGKRAAELLDELRKSTWVPPYNVLVDRASPVRRSARA
jgi:hypothetical protein